MKELENLWYKYLIENSFAPDNEINIIAKELTETEKKLKNALMPDNVDIFYRYEKCLSELNSISEKNAFIEGIRFASKFMIEALYPDLA